MARYSSERKASILNKLLPPSNKSVAEVAKEEGVSAQTLYNWRSKAKESGLPVPGKSPTTQQWSADAKLAVVIETAAMSASERSQYCREKGLYVEQVNEWKEQCLGGFQSSREHAQAAKKQAKSDRAEIKHLKKDLRIKEKALAETAALLVLRPRYPLRGEKAQCALGGRGRGMLTSTLERTELVSLIQQAQANGSRLEPACAEAGLSLRSYRRWFQRGEVQADKRPETTKPAPANKLSDDERQAIVAVCNEAQYASLPPTQIVPSLLDKGVYLASEASFYRVLKAHKQLNHRGRSQAPKERYKPTSFAATGQNQVWSWDITYLSSPVTGQYYYLYLFEDIYSRKIVGHEVHDRECGELAAQLIRRCLLREQCFNQLLVLHSDNGAPMKAQTMRAKLDELGVQSSYSRPRVSNDNPYSEALFKTLKYRPNWPSSGFKDLEEARDWVEAFVGWYNEEHKHSKLNFVTPAERHRRQDGVILSKRQQVLESAKTQRPERWSGSVRNCRPIGVVMLNPDKPKNIEVNSLG